MSSVVSGCGAERAPPMISLQGAKSNDLAPCKLIFLCQKRGETRGRLRFPHVTSPERSPDPLGKRQHGQGPGGGLKGAPLHGLYRIAAGPHGGPAPGPAPKVCVNANLKL